MDPLEAITHRETGKGALTSSSEETFSTPLLRYMILPTEDQYGKMKCEVKMLGTKHSSKTVGAIIFVDVKHVGQENSGVLLNIFHADLIYTK